MKTEPFEQAYDNTPYEQAGNGASAADSSWPEYKPLFRELPPGEEFPTEALGPILAPAARAIAKCVQVSPIMAGQAVLATANLVAQCHVNILIDGRLFPVSEFFATGAESSERKTSTDKQALRPIKELEMELMEKHNAEAEDIRLKYAIWKSEYDSILKQKIGQSKKLELIRGLGQEPKTSPEPVFILDDVTVEGLRCVFKEGRSALAICTTEGATFVNGWAMQPEQQLKTGAALSSAWDGEPIKLARAGGEKLVILHGRRLCANLFAQPDILQGLIANVKLLKQGLLSRFLVGMTISMAGERPYDETIQIMNEVEYRDYCSRIKELMQLPLPVKDKSAVLIPRALSPDKLAKPLYIGFYNAIDKEMKAGRRLADIKAFAGKTAEHALRLAGTRQFVEQHQTGIIDKEPMAGGIELAQFYLNENLRLNSVGAISDDLQMAFTLWQWLKSKKKRFFCTIETYEYGPSEIRDAAVARKFLNILAEHGIVRRSSQPVVYREIQRRECWELRQDV